MAANMFMIGPAPIRRTLPYLKSCPLIFKERVKIMEVHYNFYYQRSMPKPIEDVHGGLRDFYFWNIGPIQFKNPEVQIVRFTEMTPNPFIRCWLDDGSDVLFDCDSKSKEDIMKQLIKILGKSREQLAQEERVQKEKNVDNPAVFDFNRPRFCICEIPGQVPCSGTVPLPKKMIGKYTMYKKEDLEAWESNLDAPEPTQEETAKLFQWLPLPKKPPQPYFKGLEKFQVGKQWTSKIVPNPHEERLRPWLERQMELEKKKDEDD